MVKIFVVLNRLLGSFYPSLERLILAIEIQYIESSFFNKKIEQLSVGSVELPSLLRS